MLTAVTAPAFSASSAQPQELTGDTKTACQVILCLSTGQRPSECTPPIERYFSIRAKHWADTLRERRNFLDLCPASNQTPQMSSLVNDIVNGAGMCDAAALNQRLTTYDNCDSCNNESTTSNVMPTACSNYINNPLTNFGDKTPKYVGTPDRGGYWVDAGDYDKALAQYKKQQEEQNQYYWNN